MNKFITNLALVTVFMLLMGRSLADTEAGPLVLGRAVNLFEVGPLVTKDDFENLERWVVQVEEREGYPDEKVVAREGTLDCFLPGRGCTVWFKEKLKTRMAITYEVVCPQPEEGMRGVEVKDVNNFWLASDPKDPEKGLFDSSRYTGAFPSYNEMLGYYASSGGGRNTTTRMRRYPREEDGRLIEHIALKERDGQKEFMLTPGKKMKVQLVAFDDLVQYIVDGQLVYEMAFGDEVAVERFRRGQRSEGTDDYDDYEFPFYREGYFGFRMVGTHHIYSKFRVHALEEIDPEDVERTQVTVNSLKELREAGGKSFQDVVMAPGTYVVEELDEGGRAFELSGSHNTLDFTGVTFEMPLKTLDQMAERRRRSRCSYFISGHHNTVKGGLFVNTYDREFDGAIDFGTYNQDSENYPTVTVIEMYIKGSDNRLEGAKMIVKGSFPYGYGNMYGIGGGAVVPLRKHNGILVHGDRVVLDGCEVKMESFGHAIFAQYGDEILVKNCYVEGTLRPSNDFLKENAEGSLARKYDHRIQWPEEVEGVKVPKDHMINCAEDGIRAYSGTGRMTVENCKVVKMRGGIKLYMARGAIIRNCEVLDCVVQSFSVPSRGIIENCRGNAAYGPLLYIHMDSHSSQKVEIEVLPAPHGIGDHPLAAIKGKNHSITFTSKSDDGAQLERPIIVGYPLRFDFLSVDYPDVPKGMEENFEEFAPDDYTARGISLSNGTKHPVVLSALSEENEVVSEGEVKDLGEENMVKKMAAE
ncbi:MAG: right-handed parallel beta-helix repeat-containing protein [Roseibacillus sp.]